MNMYANQYNNLHFFKPKTLDMNMLLNSYITTNPSLIAHQSKMYLTAVNTVSNSAACYSPTDRAQIISNEDLESMK